MTASTHPGPVELRTVTEVALRSLSIHTAAIILVGHLTTLRHLPRCVQNYEVLGFFLEPLLPVGTSVQLACQSTKLALRAETRGSIAYHVHGALGMRVTTGEGDGDDEESAPLLDVPYMTLRTKYYKYDVRWLARLLVINCFIIQDIGVLVLFFRRVQASSVYGYTVTPIDRRNGIVALGSLVAALNAWGVTAANQCWCPVTGQIQRRSTDIQNHSWRNAVPLSYSAACALRCQWHNWRKITPNSASDRIIAAFLGLMLRLLTMVYPDLWSSLSTACSIVMLSLVVPTFEETALIHVSGRMLHILASLASLMFWCQGIFFDIMAYKSYGSDGFFWKDPNDSKLWAL